MNINTKRIFSKSCIAASAAALCLMATACGDDSSSSPKNDPIIENPDVPGDSTVIPGGDTPADSTIIPGDPSTPTDSTVVPGEGDETDPGELPAEGPITLPEGKGLLVDDFEDGDLQSNSGGYWFAYDDTENGASSSITFPVNDADENVATRVNNGSNYALKVNYTLDKGGYEYNPYVGWGVNISEDDSNDRFGGITYWYKGGAHTVRIETSDVTNYDVHFAKVKASRVWTQAVIRFKDLVQNGWDGEVPFDPKHMNAISFQAQGSTKVYSDSLFIDNLYLQDTSEVAPDVKDMTINDPLIPEDLSEGQDITINTELQAKAMKYLDKGINFTNWLENADGKFKKFVYDETDVKTVADAGFKSLRLPIDLDLYATNRNDFIKGTAKELEFDDETLFTVLDSFVNWTAKYNMSFVIDYHEYDNSYNRESANDPNYVKMMAETWKHVAAHYADNSREDLFFELLNEPDMTDGKVTQAQWTVASKIGRAHV